MGPLGLRFSQEDELWSVTIHPTPVELIGGRHDGEAVMPGIILDLEQLAAAFESVVAFGWNDPGFDPSDRSQIEAALTTFFPDAALVDHTWYDWVDDEFSRGTWATPWAGKPEALHPYQFAPVGRLTFATSDIATEHQGWFEGALVSGKEAAAAVNTVLG